MASLGQVGKGKLPLVWVLGTVFFILGVEGVQQCYVCSWQRPSGSFAMVDNCTHFNFKPEYASIVNCSGGCEAITYRHSKNEEIYHFSRNCLNLNPRKGLTKEDKCYNLEEKTEYLNICECHSSLCNKAHAFRFGLLKTSAAFLIAVASVFSIY